MTSQDLPELECPVTFNKYGVTAYDTPVVVCASGAHGHTASIGAIAEIVQSTRDPTCPVCRQALVSRDVELLQLDNATLDLVLQGATHASDADVKAAFERPAEEVPTVEAVAAAALLTTSSGDIISGGDAEFRGRRFAVKRVLTPTDAAHASALAEVHALGVATLDKHMQHCVVPLLAYADAGTEVRILTAQPSTSLATVMAEHSEGQEETALPGGASRLEDWIRGGLTSTRALRVLHGRQLRHLSLSAAAVALPDVPADPARLLDFSRARLASVDAASPPEEACSRDVLVATAPELLVFADGAQRRSDNKAQPLVEAQTPAEACEPPRVNPAAATDAADVYGWGVAMLAAWLGRCPFAALESTEIHQLLSSGLTESWLLVAVDDADGLHPNARSLLKECFRINPSTRPTIRSLHSQLRTLNAVLCSSARRSPRLPLSGPAWERSRSARLSSSNQPVAWHLPRQERARPAVDPAFDGAPLPPAFFNAALGSHAPPRAAQMQRMHAARQEDGAAQETGCCASCNQPLCAGSGCKWRHVVVCCSAFCVLSLASPIIF